MAEPLDSHAARFAAVSRPGLALRERAPTQINLRGDAGDAGFLAAVEAALGVRPPTEPNTAAVGSAWACLWLGPDEWLLVGASDAAAAEARLRAGLGKRHAAVTDVSCNRTVIELAGADARAVLARGCTLDLHPREFPPGRCAQTGLARAQVILHHPDPETWHLYVRASFARYLADWLLVAAR